MDHPRPTGPHAEQLAAIRRFWDDDAATYDRSPGHRPRQAAVVGAWTATLARLLPPAPSRVLDCGAGTGFLSLIAARLGHEVTALDLSPAMLERLGAAAGEEGLRISTVAGPADCVPAGPFDAVMERHLLWTLPDPGVALAAWRQVAERLVLVESQWGDTGAVERARARLRRTMRRIRRTPPDHHGEYSQWLRRSLPLGGGTPPTAVTRAAADAGWSEPEVVWLDEIAAAERRALPMPERMVGAPRRFAVTAATAG